MTQKVSLLMSAVDMISPVTAKVSEAQKELEQQLNSTRKSVSETNKAIAMVDQYRTAQAAVLKAEAANKRYTAQLKSQQEAIKATDKPTKQMADRLAMLEQKAVDAGLALQDKQRKIGTLENALVAASVDTSRLADEQERLTKKSTQFTDEAKQQGKALSVLANDYKSLTQAQQRSADIRAGFSDKAESGIVAAGAAVMGSVMTGVPHQQSLMRVQSAGGFDDAQTKDLDSWALDKATTRAGQGVNATELHKSMLAAIGAGAKTADEIKSFVETSLKVYSGFDKTKIEFEQVSNQVRRLNRLDGGSNAETENFAGLIQQNYHGLDPEGALNDYAEVRPRVDAVGMDKAVAQAVYLALLNNNMESGEISSTLESMAEVASVGKNATADQQTSYAKVGMTPEQANTMFKTDAMGYLNLVSKRIEGLDSGDQLAVTEQLLGSGFQTLLKALKSGDIKEMHSKVTTPNGGQAELNKRFEQSQEAAGAGLDAVMQSFNRLAVVISEPLLEPIGVAADYLAGSINMAADYVAGVSDSKVVFGALVVGAGAVTIALKKFNLAIKAFKGFTGLGARAGGAALTSVSAAGAVGAGTAAKFGLKALTRFIPVIGTALLVADIANFASEQLTGKDLLEHAKEAFTNEPDLTGINSQAVIPTPQQFDQAKQANQTNQTRPALEVKFSGSVDGITPELEQSLAEKFEAQIKHNDQMREGY